MGSFANTVFSILLGWMQGLISLIWSALTTENGNSFLQFIGKNWIIITIILCAVGLAADFAVYLFRWKPYIVWGKQWKRFRKQEGETEEKEQNNQFFNEKRVLQAASAEQEPQEETGFLEEDNKETDGKELSESDIADVYQPEEDLRKWEEKNEYEEENLPPPTVTKAGYTVPADSPYRRPESQAFSRNRRRRIRINLLGDSTEEDSIHYITPKPLMDQRDAYHKPVYPENWKGNREQDS